MAEYIEREAALDCFACDLGKKDYSVSYQGFMTEAAFRINDLPAADVRPVVRGKWIDEHSDKPNDPRMRCSVCTCVEAPLLKWRFCPNCGAEMEKS